MRLSLGSMFAVVLGAAQAHAGAADKRLDIVWVDVEGGAATLLVTPAGESVLFDTGNPGKRDPGRIKRAAEAARLARIDHVVITHFHSDHFGGLADLSALIPIGTVWDHDVLTAPDGERTHPKIADYKAAQVGGRVVVKPGDKLPLKQRKGAAPLTVTFLGATQRFATPKGAKTNAACAASVQREPDESDNKNSIVTLVTFGGFRFFDGGDLTWNTEGELVCPLDRVGEVDIMQADHHGLALSNNPVLVNTLRPTVAVINNGPKKGGEAGAYEALKAAPGIQAIYQVHRNVQTGPAQNTAPELTANADEACKGEPVKLSVDPKGKTYSVVVAATNHTRTYDVRPPAKTSRSSGAKIPAPAGAVAKP
jgi:beta-lactamase superfamily II metal-dependent hydrolase